MEPMTWGAIAASTAGLSVRKLAGLAAGTAWKEMVEASKKKGLDRELKVVYGEAFKGFVDALRGPFVIDHAMDERLREMFADEGFQAILAELPRARFEEVDTTRARELFAGLGPPGATADDFDSAWHSLGRVFDERIAQTTHAARLAEKYRQDRIESSVAEIAAIMRPQDKSAALAAYRRDVYNLYRLAPVRDLFWRDQESTGNEIRLADVFVEPLLQRQDLRHEVKTIEDDGRPGTEDGRELLSALRGFREDPRTLADVLALERRLVILGPPGSGKSTLAACLALTLVTDEVTLDTGLPAETVPILVPLKTYAASLKERSNLRLDAFLEEQVGRQLPDLGGRRPDGTLGESQALAQAGGAFRLSRAGADGWRPGGSGVEGADGIGRTGDPGRRSRVVDRGCPGR